ncbi:hypothetical protein [Proteiniborus sp.]|uniref:hypothetical protein n=1 Tax=Proteiniborus sp. TaxID=2079015 RepID=UPI00332B2C49
MFLDLNKKLFEVKENLRRKQKVKLMLERSKEELEMLKSKNEEFVRILHKEKRDVEKLEALSLTGLFYSILRSKEEQLDKERQEYLAAKLKYDESCNSIKYIEEEISSYEEELRKYLGLDEEYKNLLKEKRYLILNKSDENSRKLADNLDGVTDLELNAKEINEAINAGNIAMKALKQLTDTLESARSWGQWDMFGGGLLATAAKHSRIDDAKRQVNEVQRLIRIFNKELLDVNISTDIKINIGSFDTFADYFFDGLISDWIVQSKINDSLNNVNNVSRNLNKTLSTLTKELNDLNLKLEGLQKEIHNLIENA